jgi:glucosyl-3-phosphoglycerate synthase
MSDFYQNGVVTTLHRLNPDGLERLETELKWYSRTRPVGLVLPALYAEFETPAMQRIVAELERVDYLRQTVVVLAKASRADYEHARMHFERFNHPVTVIWVDSERVQSLFQHLEECGLSAGIDGKGRSCWLAYGYLLARGDCDIIVSHDCDIRNYSRQFLARLCYPVVNPNLDFEFCKGYYARVTERLHGRVTRLFMTPLVRAMEDLAPGTRLLQFLDSFRYPLSGEFAMTSNLARVNRIPWDWGLEIGMLAEVYRNCSPLRTCQVDLADNYDHKHQELSPENGSRGLRRMACDIAKTLFRTLAAEGVVLAQGLFHSLEVRYLRMAEDTLDRYYADAMLNGLEFDRHVEELAVDTFARSLQEAAADYLRDPLGHELIPNWNRVIAASPNFFDLLLEAVELDAGVMQPAVA